MGILWSLFSKPPERRPVSFGYRCWNALKNNWRGLVSTILAIIIFAVLFEPVQRSKYTLLAIWSIMFLFMLLQPMPTSACALLLVFAIPMCGIMTSDQCCSALINEHIIMFFLGGWLLLLFNNCGLDKRIICAVMNIGKKPGSFSPVKLLMKASFAALLASSLSEREMVTKAVMEYVISALQPLQIMKTESDYGALKNILCVAIAVNSLLGSTFFIHSSLTSLQLRAVFHDIPDKNYEYSDNLNYMDYSGFAIPIGMLMFFVNLGYNALLVSRVVGKKPMSGLSKEALQKTFAKNKSDLGPITNHEKLAIFFSILFHLALICRWSEARRIGWATYRLVPIATPGVQEAGFKVLAVKDATIAAFFVLLLHSLPKSLGFLKIWTVSKVRDLPKMKPESGILYWKFIDKHTDYALFFIIGASCLMQQALAATQLNLQVMESFGDSLVQLPWAVGILIVVLVSVILGNLMTGMAAQACLSPFVLAMSVATINKWTTKRHLLALGVGLGSGFGFCFPHFHTPSYFVKHVGKVDLKKQIIYSAPSTIICAIILWVSLVWLGPRRLQDTFVFQILFPGSDPKGSDAPTTASSE